MRPYSSSSASARRLLANLALSVAALALVLTAAELAVRRFDPQLRGHESLFQAHPTLGWGFVPDLRQPVVGHGGRRHEVRTNPSGFRDAPFDAIPDTAHRLAVLGDSFVANLSVPDDAVFTERLEARLPGVSVLNLGVNGYGPVQELLLLEDVLAQLAPDYAIVAVYLRNDFTDAVGGSWGVVFPKPVARLDASGALEIVPPPADARPAPPVRSGLERLHLWHLLRERVAYLGYRLRGDDPERAGASRFRAPELELTARRLRPPVAARYRIVEALLAAMEARAHAAGVPLLVVLAPSFAQVEPAGWEAVLRQAGARPEDHDRDAPNRRLARFAAGHGIALLDLTPALRAGAARGEALYDPDEQHWTARGNEVVAQALAAYLEADPTAREALALGGP